MTWPTYSVPVTGYPLLMTPLFPGGSPLVLEWRPIRSFLPKLKWGFWQEVARSPFDCYRRMNKWYSWRKHTLEPLLPSPERGHFVSSWVPLTWKASWEQLQLWAHSCMVLGMSGRAKPTFIFMMANSPVHRQMKLSSTCSNCSLTGPHFPPPAIVEALQDYVTHYYKVRRLHLIVVDLWRPWKYNTARAKAITDQLWYISHCDATHRVSPFRPDGPEPPLRCRRFAYGYALDGSECPSYLVWPQRDGHSYVLLDTSTNDTLPLNQEFFCPLGMEHFYDSFALESQISVRRAALRLFGLREDELMPDLHITRDGVLRIRLGAHQEHQVNHVARATDRTKVSAAVIQLASHEEDTAPQQDMSEGDASDSDGSESASDSEQNDPPSSLVADAEQYELMQRAYAAVGEDFTGKDDLIGAKYSKLLKLEMVPERWPLARLSFSLQTCVDHLDRVLAGCCWEVQATRITPSESLASLHEVAKCLTMELAVYLAKEVAAILRAVLTHETKKLYNDSTVQLLCSNYWIQPIYQELLHSSSRRNATRECERKRPSSGLARVTAYAKPPKQRRPSASGTSFSDWIGGTCQADTLQVWFPAHWAPVVLQQLQKKEDKYRAEHPSWMDEEVAESNGRRLGLTDVCSSRSAIIGMAPGRATSGC